MRSDILSKRVFYAGCFGLPWLWIVHVLYHFKQSVDEENDQALLNPDDHFPDENAPEMTPEEIQMETQKWVSRCKIWAIVVTSLFVAWVVIAQVLRGSVFPPSLYMLNFDDAAVTGW